MLFVLVLFFLASVAKGFYFPRELTCDFEDFHYFYSLFYFIYFLNLRFVMSHDLDLLCPISLFLFVSDQDSSYIFTETFR